MQSRIVPLIIIGAIVLVLSLWLGQGIVTNQMQTLLIAGSGVGLLICIFLGQKIWIAMFMLMAMPVPIIRGFQAPDLGMGLFVGMSVVIFMMRKIKLHWTFTEMDFLRFLLAACIFQVYARNPAGLNIFGANVVGARPYFNAALALATGIILSKYRINPKEIRWAMWASIMGSIITLPLNTFRYGLGRGPSIETVGTAAGYQGAGAGRVGKYNTWAIALSVFISSRINPLRACLHPGWALLILLCFAFAALSGFRNTVAYVGLAFLIGIAYRGGFFSVITSTVIGGFALTALALINIAYPLPPIVQRALSPFPGTWEERFVQAGQESTDWRVEMWEAALFTDGYIQNKIIGDGLGMTREEMTRIADLEGKGGRQISSGLTVQQEGMMLAGAYHSGPVQTVRTIGYVGLAVIWFAMIRMMIHMHRLIIRARNTEWFIPVFFFGIPIMVEPIFWTFVVGDFRGAATFIFISSAMIDLMNKNLPLPAYVPKRQRNAYRPLSTLPKPNTALTERRETRARKHGAASMKTREKRA